MHWVVLGGGGLSPAGSGPTTSQHLGVLIFITWKLFLKHCLCGPCFLSAPSPHLAQRSKHPRKTFFFSSWSVAGTWIQLFMRMGRSLLNLVKAKKKM